PYAPLLALLQAYATDRSSDTVSYDLTRIAPEFVDILPELAQFLPNDPPSTILDSEHAHSRRVHAFAQFLIHLTAARAAVVIVEDLHWSDDAGLDALLTSARRLAGRPILLLFTYRSDEIAPSLQHMLALLDRERLADEITLPRLASPDTEMMLRRIFDQPHPIRPDFLQAIHGLLAGVYAGPVAEGERLIQPLRELATPLLDMSGAMPFTAIQSAFDPFFPKGLLQYWKSTYVKELSDELLDTLCKLAAERPSPKTTMDIWPLTGAAARVGAAETAFGQRHPFMVAFESSWTDPTQNEANIAWAREAWASMRHFASNGVYLNFPGFGEEKEELVRAAYGANYARLQALKTIYDPMNLFRMNLNIPPDA
ncbi:MAG: BBE domain-containing protein, partial [Chloroflexota bacterium]